MEAAARDVQAKGKLQPLEAKANGRLGGNGLEQCSSWRAVRVLHVCKGLGGSLPRGIWRVLRVLSV